MRTKTSEEVCQERALKANELRELVKSVVDREYTPEEDAKYLKLVDELEKINLLIDSENEKMDK